MGASFEQAAVLVGLMLAAGAVAGFTAGLFGVGGGFIVVPALLGVFALASEPTDSHIYVAIGTSLATIIVSSARAVQAHNRAGAVDFALLRAWAPWLVIGVAAGLAIASRTSAGSLLIVFALGVLCYSVFFLAPRPFARSERVFAIPEGPGRALFASGLGGFSALLGIGGGTPFVVTMVVCGRSLHQAVATASGIGFIIAVPGALGFLLLGLHERAGVLPPGSLGYINLPALIAISALSIFTAPLGARLAHTLNELRLKRLFGVYLLVVACTMLLKAT